MNVAFLSLGGNMGDRQASLLQAVAEIATSCGHVSSRSAVYETAPWGTASSMAYLNMALKIETALDAQQLLHCLLEIERKMGRNRSGAQYEDRVIDLDLLYFNSETRDATGLVLPHPRMHLRRFVLVPLAEIAPLAIHPVLAKTTIELLASCDDDSRVEMFRGPEE